MIEKNKPFYHFINLCTYWLYLIVRKKTKKNTVTDKEDQPIWITGLFRSGTSLTTRILSILGVDLGPEEHLLKAKGSRELLNPEGFQENYLFMDWSLKVFRDLDSWGHAPPSHASVEAYDNKIDAKAFAYHSIVEIHDDRISNVDKLKAIRNSSPSNFEAYLSEYFKPPFAIKNPHFSILFPILQRQWANSKFLVVFRNPDDTIASAKKVAPTADYSLYLEYYSRLLESDLDAIYFSYDALIDHPEKSIKALALALKLDASGAEQAVGLVNANRSGNKGTTKGDWPQSIQFVYDEMNKRAINRE
ncbi:MAG: hypothetical protein ACJA1C_002834 [Crocinitomicaceae bacterium]|jgi:hypothetical protein